jgi:hypothetical protein
MVESLKNLWRHINQTGGTQRNHESKSLIRDALDYEARANYKPRHPSAVEEHTSEPAKPALVIPEPPIADDDTRPRPAVQPDTAAAPGTQDAEAVETAATEAPPPADIALEQALAARFAEPKPPEPAPAPEIEAVEAPADTAPPPRVEAEAEVEIEVEQPDAAAETETAAEIETEAAPVPPVEAAAPAPAAPPLPAPPADTTHVSIWEIFGVPPPSETSPTAPPEAAPLPAAPVLDSAPAPISAQLSAPAPTPPASGLNLAALLGWRAMQRRAQAKVRHR